MELSLPPSLLLELVLRTLGIAAAATALVALPGLALAWLLARSRGRGVLSTALEALVALPLVLPPTAIGLGLLLLLGRGGPLGGPLHRWTGQDLIFTQGVAVLAGAVVALPLLVRSARTALEEVDPRLPAVARTLGRSRLGAFLAVELPLAWRGVAAGLVLAFARALGEFGATVVVAGNIPGRTQTLALAIFQGIQTGREGDALLLAGIAALLAFVALAVVELLTRRRDRELER